MPNVESSGLLPIDEVERFLVRFEKLDCQPDSDVLARFLEGMIDCGIGDSGAIWIVEPSGSSCCAASPEYSLSLPNTLPEGIAKRGALTLQTECPGKRILAAQQFHSDSRIILDVAIHDELSQSALSQREEILEGLAEVAGNLLLRIRYGQLKEQLTAAQLTEPLLDVLCRSDSLNDAAESLAGAVLESTEADRVTILQTHSGGTSILAVAPSESIDRRSPQLRQMASLVEEVARDSNYLSFAVGDGNEDIGRPMSISTYIDASESRQIRIDVTDRGVHASRGAVFVESFSTSDTFDSRVHSINERVLPTLQQVIDHHNVGLRGFIHRFSTSRTARKWITFAVLAATVVLALGFIPADFTITADGYLHPLSSRRIFAPSDGIIEQLNVSHGAAVEIDQPLLTMRDPELDRRSGELDGEISTLTTQLDSIRAVRAQMGRNVGDAGVRLSAQEEDLKIQIDGLQRQKQLLSEHMKDLIVSSSIAGTVDRWDIAQALPGRPVTLGQHLLDIVDHETGWELRLNVSDDVIGYVNTAQSEAPCDVAFRIRSDPNVVYQSKVDWISNSTQVTDSGRLSVLTVSSLEDLDLKEPRGGAGVVAQIHCGRKSLGFVWFREVIELLQRSFVF